MSGAVPAIAVSTRRAAEAADSCVEVMRTTLLVKGRDRMRPRTQLARRRAKAEGSDPTSLLLGRYAAM